jgi:two-component system aerobic respiration control sensor histidine kinase ArcB
MLKDDFKADLPKLKALKEDGNWEAIQAIVHKLRGGCAYTGAQRLKQASNHLENYLLASKTLLREQLFQQLIGEMQAFLNIKTQDYFKYKN